MIRLHYWPTPNGHKITLFLEEAELPYQVVPVNIGRGEQFAPEFLAISPNNRMPAIVDDDPPGGGAPVSVFESGAILLYLAEKTGRFDGADLRSKIAVREWLMWQMGGLGPMFGQANHFMHYAPEKVPYGIERYGKEAERLIGVLDTRLSKTAFLAGEQYTIADMAAYPWVLGYPRLGKSFDGRPHVQRWIDAIQARPATARAMAVGKELSAPMDDDAKKILFGQGAR